MKVNILGSCISRIAMLNGDRSGHGVAGTDLQMDCFLDKENLVCAMTPPPFPAEEINTVQEDELWDRSRCKALRQCLGKDTLNLLMNSDADYLVMDLFDFQNDFAIYKNTIFSTCSHEFFNTALYRKYQTSIRTSNFMNLPTWLWYGYIDLFFEKIMSKYDADHIILNRFRSNTWYLSKAGTIERIPDSFKQPYHSNDLYNGCLAEAEQYIIQKFNPYVIDLSQYYMGDENEWDNLNGAHFERTFYRETYKQIRRIIFKGTDQRYYSEPVFPDKEDWDMHKKFDVEKGIRRMEELVNKQDILWLNILHKLNLYKPEDKRVRQYMQVVQNL